jgi:hypothetical protein
MLEESPGYYEREGGEVIAQEFQEKWPEQVRVLPDRIRELLRHFARVGCRATAKHPLELIGCAVGDAIARLRTRICQMRPLVEIGLGVEQLNHGVSDHL